MTIPIDVEPGVVAKDYPRWVKNFIAVVRPGGVAAMFLILTLFPLIFAIVEVFINDAGIRMARVLASYFQAVPEIYYSTLQVMFMAYVFGRSAENITSSFSNRKRAPQTTVQADSADVNVDQRSEPNV